MDKIASMFGEKVGDMVEDAVKNALGVGDKDEDKDEKKGGIFSFFGSDDKKDKEKEKEEEKGGFFSKIFDRDNDDDKSKEKKSGFAGLFVEPEGAGAATGNEGGTVGGGEQSGGCKGQNVGVSDGDLLNDLINVAEETSQGGKTEMSKPNPAH